MSKIVFLNASKNRNGLTAELAHYALADIKFNTVNLVDYNINQIGQETKADEFKKVINELTHSNVIIIGTPVYWSDMTGYLKTFIDRLSDIVDQKLDSEQAPLRGANVYLIIQGTAPEDAYSGIITVIEHICRRFFMNYRGLIKNKKESLAVNKELKKYKEFIKGKNL